MKSNTVAHQDMAVASLRKWGVIIWIGLGIVLLLASFDINFALERTVEILVASSSFLVGALVVSNKRLLNALKQSEPSTLRRAGSLLVLSLSVAAVSWANLYSFCFAVHSFLAEISDGTLAVSSKSEARPYRQQWTSCKQYVRFKEFDWPGGKFCVSREVFDRVEFGNLISAVVLRSPVGLSIERIGFEVQANPAVQGTLGDEAAQRP
jgi:uncharacterized membrane protein